MIGRASSHPLYSGFFSEIAELSGKERLVKALAWAKNKWKRGETMKVLEYCTQSDGLVPCVGMSQ